VQDGVTEGDGQHRRHQVGGVGGSHQHAVGAVGEGLDRRLGVGRVAEGEDPGGWHDAGNFADHRQTRLGRFVAPEIDDGDVGPDPAHQLDGGAGIVGGTRDDDCSVGAAVEPASQALRRCVAAGDHHDFDRVQGFALPDPQLHDARQCPQGTPDFGEVGAPRHDGALSLDPDTALQKATAE
jgi:hypothetical protein